MVISVLSHDYLARFASTARGTRLHFVSWKEFDGDRTVSLVRSPGRRRGALQNAEPVQQRSGGRWW
jgi:hypothetical protein